MTRYRVFISSTIDDLQEERGAVEQELTAMEIFEAIRVESLPAADITGRKVCLDEVGASDAVVLLLKDRYGFVPQVNNPESLSVTHLEYREAVRRGKPVFAFLRDEVQPEQRLVQFIREVSDFDEGLLRKKWGSIEELKRETRRALIFWMARKARQGTTSGEGQRLARSVLEKSELRETPVALAVHPPEDGLLQEWAGRFIQELSTECDTRFLSRPRRVTEEQEVSEPVLHMRVWRKTRESRLGLLMERSLGGPARQGRVATPPPVEIDVAETHEGLRFAAQVCLAIVLLDNDDWPACIDQLLKVAASRSASRETASRLITTAGLISTQYGGQKAFEVAKQILTLPRLDGIVVSAGTTALLAAQDRYQYARADHALAEAERLAFELLTSALRRHEETPETLYNLARQLLKRSRELALAFYRELVQVEPGYDERWYFHRDVGLIHYSERRYEEATKEYDLARHLKQNDSELHRFAGDAYYYQGNWAQALMRYERALAIEPVERYFLDAKIEFSRTQIRRGLANESGFVRRRRRSEWLSDLGVKCAQKRQEWTASWLFRMAKRVCALNFAANTWLALYANRRGDYEQAIAHLMGALAVRPEDPATRLNLVANLVFSAGERLEGATVEHARGAIFHGGPETLDQFRLRLTNSEKRDELCHQFEEIFQQVKREREEWRARRGDVLKPERFGAAVHIEFRE